MNPPIEFKVSDPWDYKAHADQPDIIELTDRSFAWISGQGDPNGLDFAQATGALYSLSYAVRMSYRAPEAPAGAGAYVVGVLQGQWDISAADGQFDPAHKERLVWTIMIRQPAFLDQVLFARFRDEARAKAVKKKEVPPVWFDRLEFGLRDGGRVAQILHWGPYDDEPATFARLEAALATRGLQRSGHTHREIYHSDPRKTAPEKMKTILRVALM